MQRLLYYFYTDTLLCSDCVDQIIIIFLYYRKGSRLKKTKANLSDSGTYECIVKNVGGEIKQQSVISISGGKFWCYTERNN